MDIEIKLTPKLLALASAGAALLGISLDEALTQQTNTEKADNERPDKD